MKILGPALFAAVVSFFLAACGDDKGKTDETIPEKTPEEATQEEVMFPQCADLDDEAGGRFCCEQGQVIAGGSPPRQMDLWCEAGGVRQGPARRFHPEGRLHWNTRFNKGLEDGIRVAWHPSGAKQSEMGYQDGKLHGPWKEWGDAADQLEAEGTYESGLKSGSEAVYHKNGNKKALGTYLDGRRHGLWTEWRGGGMKKSEVEYTHGIRNGTETFWHRNGQIWYRDRYEDGKRVGVREEWTPEGLPLTGPAVK